MVPKPLKQSMFVAPLLLLVLWVPQALAVDVNLAWNATTTYTNGAAATDLAGYRLYYWQGTQATGTPQIINVGKQTPYATVPGLVAGAPYTFAVAAYNTAGNEGVRAFLTVTISSVNRGPVAGDDTTSTPMGTSTTLNVLGNDTDADGNPLTIAAVTQAANGTVAIISTSNGPRVLYTPRAGYSGNDSFNYTIIDGKGGTDIGTVFVVVLSGNRLPVAMDDAFSIPADMSFTMMVRANDTDADGNTLTITAVTTAAHGTVTIIDSGTSLRYTPAAGYVGNDSFDYTIKDAPGASATATVTVTVLPDRAASLVAAYNFNEGSGATVSDVSGHSNTGTIRGATWTTAGKFGGALVFNGTDAWVTIPDTASLRLTTAMTLAAWVFPTTTTGKRDILLKEGTNVDIYNLYARNENGLPESNIFVGGTNRIAQGGGVSANVWTHVASTYDGATMRLFINGVQVASAAASGAIATSTGPLRIGGNSMWGEFFQGRIDEIRIYNTVLTSAEIQADMQTPTGTNRAPLAVADTASVTAGTPTPIPVLTNDTDADGDSLSITAVTQGTAGGSVTLSGSSVTYRAAATFAGTDTFTYTISDGQGGTTTATVTVTVLPGRAASLVAAYNFNEGSGATVSDVSGHNNTGTIRGATWTTAGKFGGALVFNGTDAWVTIPDTASLRLTTAMTLAAWVFPTTTTGKRDILLKEGTNVDIYNLYARNENGLPESNIFVGGTNRIAQGGGVSANVWTHVASTYDGATMRLFINGVQVASAAASGAIATSTGPLRIGGNSMWGEFFQGRIDEIRIYNTVLTSAEIQADMGLAIQ